MYRRGKIWWATIGGVRKSSGTAVKKDALAWLARQQFRLWEQQKMGVKPPKTWEEAVVRYLRECEGTPSYRWKTIVLRWWAERFDTTGDLRSITRDTVAAVCEPLATVEPSPGNNTLNKRVAILHHLLSKACEEWEWIERVPKFRTYPIPQGKDLWLTLSQWNAICGLLPVGMRDFCTLALATGLRSGLLVDLQWSQYDHPRRVLNVSGTRNKRANPIPLNQTAIDVLESRRLAKTRHLTRVFPEFDERRSVSTQEWWIFKRLREQHPELPLDRPIHTLRHTFNTWLAQAGIPKEIRMVLMGHAKTDVHSVYTHWSEANLRPAVEVIDRVLAQEPQRAARY